MYNEYRAIDLVWQETKQEDSYCISTRTIFGEYKIVQGNYLNDTKFYLYFSDNKKLCHSSEFIKNCQSVAQEDFERKCLFLMKEIKESGKLNINWERDENRPHALFGVSSVENYAIVDNGEHYELACSDKQFENQNEAKEWAEYLLFNYYVQCKTEVFLNKYCFGTGQQRANDVVRKIEGGKEIDSFIREKINKKPECPICGGLLGMIQRFHPGSSVLVDIEFVCKKEECSFHGIFLDKVPITQNDKEEKLRKAYYLLYGKE